MKNKSKLLIGLLMGMLVFLGACEEENDYDFNAIEPVIASIAGPNLVAAHGLTEFPSTYRVPHRGGSTFEWSVTTQGGGGATIVLDDEFSSVANITFNQSSVADVATITVKETTMGGKTAELSRTVNLDPFCPQDMAPWAGTWGSHNFLGEDDYGVTNVDIEVITTALNTIRIRNFFDWVVVGFWAENWIPGVGGNGHFVLEVDCNFPEFAGTVLLGETVEWTTYWMDYTGSFDLDAKTITVNYDIAWTQGGDPWNSLTAVLSMDKQMVEAIRNMQSFPTK